MGAKYVPCMKKNASIPDEQTYPCTKDLFNITNYQGSARIPNVSPPTCNYWKLLEETCGMGGFSSGKSTQPDQFFRFITPMFLHSGIVHFLFNGLSIWKTGFQMEEQMGSWRMFILYFISGIGGNLFSSVMRQRNCKKTSFGRLRAIYRCLIIVTVGASGAIYGLYGVLYVDLFVRLCYDQNTSDFSNLVQLAFACEAMERVYHTYGSGCDCLVYWLASRSR